MTQPTQDPFFLTRQSANIMEELLRRLKLAGSISLVYGARGTGKSHLLDHFLQTRLQADEVILVRFTRQQSCFVTTTEGESLLSNDLVFSQVLSGLNENLILVIDQFELARPELQQIVLKFWANEAEQKKLKLVIGTQQGNLPDLLEQSKRFQLQIDSVELTALKVDEQIEYLRSFCCPALRQKVEIPSELKKQLKLTNGLFSQLAAFRFQHETDILCQDNPLSTRSNISKTFFYALSGLLIVSFTVIAVFQNINTDEFQTQDLITELKVVVPLKNQPEKPESKVVEILPAPAPAPEPEPEPEFVKVNDDDDRSLLISQPRIQHIVEEKQVEEISIPEAPNPQPGFVFFQQRLQATKLWLSSAELKTASIQLMTVISDNNPQKSINIYLKKLQSKQIDLEMIKIFPLTKGGRQMYSVLYGEYADLNTAYLEIKRLPNILKANKPIPRTVKGINIEISGS